VGEEEFAFLYGWSIIAYNMKKKSPSFVQDGEITFAVNRKARRQAKAQRIKVEFVKGTPLRRVGTKKDAKYFMDDYEFTPRYKRSA
jgi:hypothetical protein